MLRRASWSYILRISICPKSGVGLSPKLPIFANTYRHLSSKNASPSVASRHSDSTTTNAPSGMRQGAAFTCHKCGKLFKSLDACKIHLGKHVKKGATKDAKRKAEILEKASRANLASKSKDLLDSIRSLCHDWQTLVENDYKPENLVSSTPPLEEKAREDQNSGKGGSISNVEPRPCVALRYNRLPYAYIKASRRKSQDVPPTPGQLTVVDVLTGEVLVSSPVSTPEADTATEQKKNTVNDTTAKNSQSGGGIHKDEASLQGLEGARRRLSDFIDGNTIIVGYSPRLHFELLGLRHSNIVDLAILLSAKMENGLEERVKWKRACKHFFGRVCRDEVGRTLAIRSLIQHYVAADKEILNRWVRKHLEEMKRARDGGRAERRIKRIKRPSGSNEWDRMSRSERQMVLRDNNIHPWTEGFEGYFDSHSSAEELD